MIYSYDKGNYLGMNQKFSKIPWQEMMRDRTVDEMWLMLSEEVLSTIEDMVPHKYSKCWSNEQRSRPIFQNRVSSLVHMYADDTKLGRRIESIADNHLLQKDFIILMEWSTKWQLRFNASKCRILNIGSR